MGHERIGTLPKTRRWRELVQQIASLYSPGIDVPAVAKSTLQNVRTRFQHIHRDPGVLAAFRFLTALAVACRSEDPSRELQSLGVRSAGCPTPLAVAKAVRESVAPHLASLEYGEIAQSAAIDALVIWYRKNKPTQCRLFEIEEEPFEVWRKAGSAAGFCELARIFFGKFTERYLNYFLEREASAVLKGLNERDRLREELREYVDQSARHAFETAGIMQSYAAGWFAKHAKDGVPEDDSMMRFLAYAFGKISEELRRESEK